MTHAAAGASSRFTLRRISGTGSTFGEDVREGLGAVRKAIPPRWFYDELGSALFDAICRLPEYYVTRAEEEILRRHGRSIATALGTPRRLVEIGSGSARKTRLLLGWLTAADPELQYVPLDIDATVLAASGRDLIADYPSLRVTAVCADFAHPAEALRDALSDGGRTAVLFLGSTIGNLHRRDAVAMLRDVRQLLEPGDVFLLGTDLKKPRAILIPAYDDALGVTAAFNLNLLQRINRELGGRFDLRAFAHRAVYDDENGRIEMHLVSLREQSVLLDQLGMEVALVEGEAIHTENSYKYDDSDITALAAESGFEASQQWTDSNGWFADTLLVAR